MPEPSRRVKEYVLLPSGNTVRVSSGNPGRQSRFPSGSSLKARIFPPSCEGSDTQWYKNVLQNPSIRIDARAEETGCMARVEDRLGAIGYAVDGIPKAVLIMANVADTAGVHR